MTRYLLASAAILLACTPSLAQAPHVHWVMFEPESAALGATAESQLQRYALDIGDRRVVIRGHADPSEGGEAQAIELSQRRATVVHDHLQAYGVSVERMTVQASGLSSVGAGNPDDARQNRRVEVLAYLASP